VRPFDVVTFDCYGTLIDWETGIARAFQDSAACRVTLEAHHRDRGAAGRLAGRGALSLT
jgi:FMN phosphatase YigB (HAD superfamily)